LGDADSRRRRDGRAGDLQVDEFHRPKTFFSSFTQTGCTRNMHFAYKVSTTAFGQRKGCLFYDLGCRGPMTRSPCNRILWNCVSSKTRAGMPCLGCTEPEFPFFDLAPGTVFNTQTVMGLPKDLPEGVSKETATMTIQTLDISPVGRVEGDLDVRVDIENGVVTNAWTRWPRRFPRRQP
jgi:Ni,Fe-hydrogenase I small subunit